MCARARARVCVCVCWGGNILSAPSRSSQFMFVRARNFPQTQSTFCWCCVALTDSSRRRWNSVIFSLKSACELLKYQCMPCVQKDKMLCVRMKSYAYFVSYVHTRCLRAAASYWRVYVCRGPMRVQKIITRSSIKYSQNTTPIPPNPPDQGVTCAGLKNFWI